MVSNKANESNKRGFNQMANRQRFKQGNQHNPMNNIRNMSTMLFNANQLGDNPGFMDFNDDSIGSTQSVAGNSSGGMNGGNSPDVGSKNINGNRRMNPNMKRPMKNGNPGMRNRMNGMPGWGPPMAPPNMFPGPSPTGRRGPMHPPPIPPPPNHFRNAHGGGARMPRGPQNGRYGTGPQGPMSLLAMNRPLPAPIPPMAGRPLPPPHGMGRMMPPPLRQGPDGPVRRNTNGNLHSRGMGPKMNAFPRNGMATNGVAMGQNGKRAKPKNLPNREEYPLDKPWVTEEIKAEHDRKTDLANRLKRHRDDALFAQFKEQRDTFVKMYEAARTEFMNKNPEQDVEKILTEPSACKKARIENVEKLNDGAVSADKITKTEESNCSSTLDVAPTATPTESSDTTESASEACVKGSVVSSTSSATTTTTNPSDSNNDSTEITAIAINDKTASAETTTQILVAAEDAIVDKKSNEALS